MYLLPRMMLLLLLSAGSSLAVDANWLARIVNALRREYRVSGQFCLAANIPRGQDPNTLNQVLQNDGYREKVEQTLHGGEVYVGNAVVLAKPVSPVHAEPRVLENLEPLMENSQGHVLVIYSYLSPCSKCTGRRSRFRITDMIRDNVVNQWTEYAFVFTTLFTKPSFSMAGQSGSRGSSELTQSLTDLADSGLRLRNIFRCYKPQTEFQCYSCSSRGQLTNVCVDDNAQPQQGGSRSSSSDRSGSRSSDRSGSRSRDRSGSRSRDRSGSRSRDRSGSRSRDRSGSSSRDRSGSSSSGEVSRKRPRYGTQSQSSNRGRRWDRSNRRNSERSGRSRRRSSSRRRNIRRRSSRRSRSSSSSHRS